MDHSAREYCQGKARHAHAGIKLKKIHAWLPPFAHSIADKYLLRDPKPGPKYNRKQEKDSSFMEHEAPTVLDLMLPVSKSLFTL